jgi:hypothetical protein
MRPVSIVAGILILCGLAGARDREFETIVRRIEMRCDTRPTHIPFFGFANFIVKVVRPAGASDLKLAIFEDMRRPIFSAEEDFTNLMQGALGAEWRPFVSVRNRRDNEWTCMYTSTSGKDWKLLIATVERREATVVRIKLNPEGMLKWVSKPCNEVRSWRRD